jgi:sulfoxide reductase heme-binding subunit YedZ
MLAEGSAPPRSWWRANWHRLLAHAVGLFTLAWLALDYLREGGSFTFNRTLMLRTGAAAMALLVASFACTPLSKVLGWPQLTQIRRALGLYAFFYACLHVWNYAVLENALDPALIVRDLGERPAMPIGLLALLALVPLAVTSTRGWQQRLGRRWKVLHRLVYLAVPLAVWHYLWLDRDILTLPLLYAAIIAVLFILRFDPLRRALRALLRR